MFTCRQCGGKLERAHRSPIRRLFYIAVYRCTECRSEDLVPRFTHRLGGECRCPRCGTTRLTKLRQRDQIDRMETGLWNLLSRIIGGKIYHCCFCRLQFYDHRRYYEVTKKSRAAVPSGHGALSR